VVLFDADAQLRLATAPGGVALPRIFEVFGKGVFSVVPHPGEAPPRASGAAAIPGVGLEESARQEPGAGLELDRAALAKVIFPDPQKKQALESILHPLVWQGLDDLAPRLGPDGILVAEIPLVTESRHQDRFDVIVTVDAPLETRLQRLEARGLSRENALNRIATQATEEQRRAITHLWVRNEDGLDQLSKDAKCILGLLS
jgi:dephospho-coA kinase